MIGIKNVRAAELAGWELSDDCTMLTTSDGGKSLCHFIDGRTVRSLQIASAKQEREDLAAWSPNGDDPYYEINRQLAKHDS